MIVKELPSTGDVWIVPDGEFHTAIASYDAVTNELTRLTNLSTDAVTSVTTNGGGMNLLPEMAVASAAAAVPALISLFATSRTVVTAGVTLDFKSAAAAVAAADPELPVSVLGITPPANADLNDLIKGLQTARDALDAALVKAQGEWSPSSDEAAATAEAEHGRSSSLSTARSSPPSSTRR